MDIPKISLRCPSDLVAVVPYLCGFHPADSVVVLGLRAKRIHFHARLDLPEPQHVVAEATQLAGIVARQHVTKAMIVGYGPEPVVTPTVETLRTELRKHRIEVPEMLRVADGRYWSYVCRNPDCCKLDGTPYDSDASVVAATATVAGVNVLPSRKHVAHQLDPIGGADALAMRSAVIRADERLSELLTRPTRENAREVIHRAGREAVDAAVLQTAYGGRLADEDVAWLGLLLINTVVRDYAWERVTDDITLHIELWTDIMRRVQPELVAAPATLLAFSAWRNGGGAIASIALERALTADPGYPMAKLLGTAFETGLSPNEYMRVVDATEEFATSGKPIREPSPPRRPRRRGARR
jgi:hypothetical protein